jgi:hypothetical protein
MPILCRSLVGSSPSHQRFDRLMTVVVEAFDEHCRDALVSAGEVPRQASGLFLQDSTFHLTKASAEHNWPRCQLDAKEQLMAGNPIIRVLASIQIELSQWVEPSRQPWRTTCSGIIDPRTNSQSLRSHA